MADEAQVTFGGITITSTTEDQAALDTVRTVPESPEPDPTPAAVVPEVTPPASAEPAPTPPAAPEVPTPPPVETPEQYSKRVQARIDGILATTGAASREQDRRIAELEGQLATQHTAGTPPEPAVAPNPADFTDNADGYIQALAASEATNATNAALATDREQREVAQQATRAEQVQARWGQSVREMRERHADYEALTQQAATTETLGQEALNQVMGHLAETPQGAEILHGLLTEPGALTRVSQMSQLDQVRDFAVRASRVEGVPVSPSPPSPPVAPATTPVTPPIPPVSPGAATVPKSPDEMTPAEYNKWADQHDIRTG
jgi:hypothetical protein